MNAFDLLLVVGPAVLTVVSFFPYWGPVGVVVTAFLLWRAVQLSGRDGEQLDTGSDTVREASEAPCSRGRRAEDTNDDTLTIRAVASTDTVPGACPDTPVENGAGSR